MQSKLSIIEKIDSEIEKLSIEIYGRILLGRLNFFLNFDSINQISEKTRRSI